MADELSTSGSPAVPASPAPSTEPAQTVEPGPASPQAAEPPVEPDPLSAAERAELDAIKDPEERIKGFQRAYTRKFQAIAEKERGISEWEPVVSALKADPAGTIRHLAAQVGLKVADPEAVAVKETAVDLGTEITTALTQSLGPEYGDLAERLAPGFARAVELAIAKHTAPLQERQEQLVQDAALREANLTLDAFGKAHPDWKQHEPAMMALAKEFQPGPGISEMKWLESLYTLVTVDQRTADKAKAAITRMTKSAEAAETPTTTLAGDKVTDRPPRNPTFREAFEAAKAGKRFE